MDLPQAVGYVGSLLSTVGLGVVTPDGGQGFYIASVLAAMSGMVMLTLTVSYIFNVTAVVNASRALAHRLDLLRERMDRQDGESALRLVMHSCEHLLDQATMLAERRQSFPLAVLYDREGSERDVRRAAAAFEHEMHACVPGSDRVTTTRIEMLHAVIRLIAGQQRDGA